MQLKVITTIYLRIEVITRKIVKAFSLCNETLYFCKCRKLFECIVQTLKFTAPNNLDSSRHFMESVLALSGVAAQAGQ